MSRRTWILGALSLGAMVGLALVSAQSASAAGCTGTGTSTAWGITAPICATTAANQKLPGLPSLTITSITPTSTSAGTMSVKAAGKSQAVTVSNVAYTYDDSADWTVTMPVPTSVNATALIGSVSSAGGVVTQNLFTQNLMIDNTLFQSLPTTFTSTGVKATADEAVFTSASFSNVKFTITKSDYSAVTVSGNIEVTSTSQQYTVKGTATKTSMSISVTQVDSSGTPNTVQLTEVAPKGFSGAAVGTVTLDGVTVSNAQLCFSTYPNPQGMPSACPAMPQPAYYAFISSMILSGTKFTNVLADLTAGQNTSFAMSATMTTASNTTYAVAGTVTPTSQSLNVSYSGGAPGDSTISIALSQSPQGFTGCYEGTNQTIGQTTFGTTADPIIVAFSSSGSAGFASTCSGSGSTITSPNVSASQCTINPNNQATLFLSGSMVNTMGTFESCMVGERGTITNLYVSGANINVTSTPSSSTNSFSFTQFMFSYNSPLSTSSCLTFTTVVSGTAEYGSSVMSILASASVNGTNFNTKLTVACGTIQYFSLAVQLNHNVSGTMKQANIGLTWCSGNCPQAKYAYLNGGSPITYSKGFFGAGIIGESASWSMGNIYCASKAKDVTLSVKLNVNVQFDLGIYSTNGSAYTATLGAGFSGSASASTCNFTEQIKTTFYCTWQTTNGNSDTVCKATVIVSGYWPGNGKTSSWTQYF